MRKVILVIFLFWFLPAKAADISFFLGAHPEALPGSIRMGINSWEFGYVAPATIGVVKVFRSEWKFAEWGFCLSSNYGAPGGGMFAGMGLEPKLFWKLTFRLEFYGYAASNANVKGGALVGLGLRF